MDDLRTSARVAGPADVDAVVTTLANAFLDDPVWGATFPDAARREVLLGNLWRYFVGAGLRYPWTFVTEGEIGSVALWIPPGGIELTDDEATAMQRTLVDAAGRAVADEVDAILEACEDVHPPQPYFYLSLLGTHAAYRGRGLGMSLLRESLRRIDRLGLPAYLESSNPVNDRRYASVGFVPRDRVVLPAGQVITTMWRPAR